MRGGGERGGGVGGRGLYVNFGSGGCGGAVVAVWWVVVVVFCVVNVVNGRPWIKGARRRMSMVVMRCIFLW